MSDSHQVSRRQFLRHTAVASAAVALPYVIPSGILAAPGEAGPNDRIGIAGIGVGRQGGGRFLAAANNDLGRGVAVADATVKVGPAPIQVEALPPLTLTSPQKVASRTVPVASSVPQEDLKPDQKIDFATTPFTTNNPKF